jgi:hypothetical protein
MSHYDRSAVRRIHTQISDLRHEIRSMDAISTNTLEILNTMDRILDIVGDVLGSMALTPPANPSQEIL